MRSARSHKHTLTYTHRTKTHSHTHTLKKVTHINLNNPRPEIGDDTLKILSAMQINPLGAPKRFLGFGVLAYP